MKSKFTKSFQYNLSTLFLILCLFNISSCITKNDIQIDSSEKEISDKDKAPEVKLAEKLQEERSDFPEEPVVEEVAVSDTDSPPDFLKESNSPEIIIETPEVNDILETKKENESTGEEPLSGNTSEGTKEKLLAKEMILIPEGTFFMGSEDEKTETPLHEVNVPAFYIDKYEVTNGEFEEFVNSTGYKGNTGDWQTKDNYNINAGGMRFKTDISWKDAYRPGMGKNPVVNVTYFDAVAYAKWAGKRLPTEIEWEKAARGTDRRQWPWGNEFEEEMTNLFAGDDFTDTAPVGSFPEDLSPYGVYDMAGNVSEWTSSTYVPYQGCTDPKYLNFSKEKYVLRGGSFSTVNFKLSRAHTRTGSKPQNNFISVGFRLVKDR